MGCTPSKQSVCRNCNAPCSPVRRSYSSYPRYSPPRHDDNRHVVALTPTTLGYLLLQHSRKHDRGCKDKDVAPAVARVHPRPVRRNVKEKEMTKNAPRTPIRTPPGEPETINMWELMEGLDDASPLLHPPSTTTDHIRCFPFNDSIPLAQSTWPSQQKDSIPLDQSTWPSQQKDSIPLDQVQSTSPSQQKDSIPLDQIQSTSPSQQNDSFPPDQIQSPSQQKDSIPLDEVQYTLPSHQKDLNTEVSSKPLTSEKHHNDSKKPLQSSKKETGEKLILYFTSLRGVRKTYEDCCYVRVILKNSGIRVDERDVSMHSGFKDELKELLGDRYGGGGLPRVFVGRKCIGGVDEIRRFHDEFKLEKVLEGCEMDVDCGGGAGGCDGCGDVRFLPCETCSGSCKIYHEVNSDEGEKEEVEEDESDNYGFQRCPDCNENGLMRCPICCN